MTDAGVVARLRAAVGSRVVVRYRPDPGDRAMVDVLGTLESVDEHGEGRVRVRADRDGSTVEVPLAAVVAGKPVPPRPPRRPRR